MRSIATCYRCALLVILPLVIVFSVLHYTSLSLFTTVNNSLSKNAPGRNCTIFNVSDTRPFFEREPLQLDLPRRLLNLPREDLLRQLKLRRLVTVGCGRNVEVNLDRFRKYTEAIVDLFHPSSRIIVVESDSSDGTLAKLLQWPRAEVHTLGNLSRTVIQRTDRLAMCRNILLNRTRQLQPDYLFVVDIDVLAVNVSSFLTNFDYDTNDWSVMTANLNVTHYYDIWALRTLSDSVLNYDVWHRVWSTGSHSNYCRDSLEDNIVYIHQKRFPMERGLLEVRSAFGGASLYQMASTNGCYYSAEGITCEHVPLHECMREKNRARIFINPRFTNE